MHHRTKDFEAIFQEIREGLSWLYQAEGDVITLAASGSGGMEATVANLLSPGEKALIVEGGKFGERWVEICAAYGVETDILSVEWGRSVNVDEIEARLKAGGHRALFVQASETSTGAKHDVRKIAETTRRVSPDTLIGVDAITALGVYDIQPSEWDLDAVITGSQKALMLPPGLAFVWLSARAWAAAEVSRSPRYYFDLRIERKIQAKNTTAWTPAISLIAGLKVAFDMMRKEGLENIFARHARLAAGTRAAFSALGLEIFPKDLLSESVSAVSVPDGIDGKAIPRLMQGAQGITIAGGQGHLTGKIFRIGHMGYVDESDIFAAIGGLEAVLAGLGHGLTKGAGLVAAQEEFCK
jgi:aspartate aminotransferase-like enzyme